jgi:hypothetical protein
MAWLYSALEGFIGTSDSALYEVDTNADGLVNSNDATSYAWVSPWTPVIFALQSVYETFIYSIKRCLHGRTS